jgi:hypothetical protein
MKSIDLVLEKGLEVYLDELYEAKAVPVLIAEIVRFVTAQETAHRVLYHEDIDLTKMNNLAKVEEEQHKNRYLSYAEQQKHKEK